MTLSIPDSNALACKNDLPRKEKEFIDKAMSELIAGARESGISLAMDDRAARLEAALIRYMIESRTMVGCHAH
jgi:predicted nucleic acid-binding protein